MAVKYSPGLTESAVNHLLSVFDKAVIAIYTGSQPASADLAETGTLLGYLTLNGDPFTPVTGVNGLVFEGGGVGIIRKPAALDWSIIPIASGTPGWARLYSKEMTTGLSPTANRFDLACGVASGEFRFALSTLTFGIRTAVNTFSIQVFQFA